MQQYSPARHGNALLLTMILLIVMASLASSLTELTVGNNKLRNERDVQLRTFYAAESAANLGVGHFQDNWSDYAAVFAADPTRILELDIEGYTQPAAKSDLEDERFQTDHINGFKSDQLRVWLSVINRTVKTSDGGSYVSTNPLDWQYKIDAIAVFGGSMDIDTAKPGSATVYRVENGDTNNLIPVHYAIERDSVATYRSRRVEIAIYPAYLNNTSQGSILANSLYSIAGYDFKGAAATDSWHSDNPYVPGVSTGNGDLGSAGNINVQKEQNVDGDVNENMDMKLPEFDYDYLADEVKPTYLSPIPGVLTTGSYEVDEIPYHHPLKIVGDVILFVDGPISLDKDDLDLSNGTLTLYQNDYPNSRGDTDMHFSGHDQIGLVEDNGDGTLNVKPENLIWITEYSGDFQFNGNGAMAGILFAPDASFQMNGNFDFFGAMVAGSMHQGQINGTFDFHYDDKLGSASNLPNPLSVLRPKMVVTGWRSSTLGYGAALPY